MSLWTRIKSWADENAQHVRLVSFPDEGAALRANESYLRLWLSDMFLSRRTAWFTEWFPSVASSVRLKFGDHPAVTLTHVARAPQEAFASGVLLNFPVTELLPFRGGVVEVEGALVALRGASHLQAVVKVIGNFAELVTAPIGEALEIATRVATGVDELIGESGKVHLSLHHSFADEAEKNPLQPGYFAVILDTSKQIDRERLTVVDGQLHYAGTRGAAAEALTGYDYMLYRLEVRQQRDDWRLRNIEGPLNQAIEAVLKGEEANSDAYTRVALVAALTSPDLTVPDRRRVAQAIKDELAAIRDLGLGAAPRAARDLNGIMEAHAMPLASAAALGEMTLSEAFG
jgi:hypothetical protein